MRKTLRRERREGHAAERRAEAAAPRGREHSDGAKTPEGREVATPCHKAQGRARGVGRDANAARREGPRALVGPARGEVRRDPPEVARVTVAQRGRGFGRTPAYVDDEVDAL